MRGSSQLRPLQVIRSEVVRGIRGRGLWPADLLQMHVPDQADDRPDEHLNAAEDEEPDADENIVDDAQLAPDSMLGGTSTA